MGQRRLATPTRVSIAKGLIRTQREVVEASATAEAIADRMVGFRNRHRDVFAQQGINLSYLGIISWAVKQGIKKYPIFRSRWEGTESERDKNEYFISEFSETILGIAVGLQRGLKIGVLYEEKTVTPQDFLWELQGLVSRIKDQKALQQDFDIDRATFTINNYGASGVLDFGTPRLPYGHAGTLGIGSIKRRPIGISGAPYTVYLTLVFDHRLMDGEPFANNFLKFLRDYLENLPENLPENEIPIF